MPATIGWRRRDEDGMIVTWDLPNGAEVAPMPAESLRHGIDLVEEKWGELCREIGARHQLPDGWLQAMIWRESAGNPRAFRQEKNKDGSPRRDASGRLVTGVGLMQITSPALKKNRTDTELFDPGLNVELGAGYVSYLASRPDTKGGDGLPDFARIAAAFNAGSVRDSSRNRWGMVQTNGHVDSEVAALNYWTLQRALETQQAAAMAFAHQFTTIELTPDMGSVAEELEEDDAEPSV